MGVIFRICESKRLFDIDHLRIPYSIIFVLNNQSQHIGILCVGYGNRKRSVVANRRFRHRSRLGNVERRRCHFADHFHSLALEQHAVVELRKCGRRMSIVISSGNPS